MAIFPKDIVSSLKTGLVNSPHLTYVEVVAIQKYRYDNLPLFFHHCIIIQPSFVQAVTYGVSQKYLVNSIHLNLLAVMNYTEEDAFIADVPAASPPNVGILAMYEDVFTTLYENDLGGEISLIPGQSEFDEPSFFEVVTLEEREGFFMEARVEYRPKGGKFIGPFS